MNSNLSILKKGIILIAIPLAFQLVFLGIFLATQGRVDRAQEMALHTKDVLAKVEAVYRRLIEGQGALGRLVLTGDLGRYEVPGRSLAGATREADDLID